MRSAYFISDLHLAVDTKARFELLMRFCESIAGDALSLYMLGDVFAYWAGPGLSDALLLDLARALFPLKKARVPIYFMPGNRDFLLLGDRLRPLGIQYLSDPSIIYVGGRKLLLSHGDRYLVDTTYQRYRGIAQHPRSVDFILGLPTWIRKWIVRVVRQHSEQKNKPNLKTPIFDDAALMQAMKPDGHTVIHGHIHVPAMVTFGKDNTYTRYVLAEWFDTQGYFIRVNASGIEAKQFPQT